MFRRSKGERIKAGAVNASEIAFQLAQDKRFRKRLLSAIEHGSSAGRRTRGNLGLTAAIARLARDEALRAELRDAQADLKRAYGRLDAKRRGHKARNLFALAGLASLAAVPGLRKRAGWLWAEAAKALQSSGGSEKRAPSTEAADQSSRPRSLDDLTKEELYARAQEADIPGRSEMSKDELVKALRTRS